ncbi:unnamed protein product [Adineta steineri]|uniref:G-protein coupled receptors family 1 profile domain-containing protein n=1 Tax=Adineta steineri TaxID=433720 RepID=A0A815VVS6_9BILA|nr:unnamed protein product [Adineta steineri]CAF1657059.1 unnamed protein product [Adineta steineri]
MSIIDNTSFNDISLYDDDTRQFYLIQFWVFLLLIIPSISASLFALYHFLHDKNLRKPFHNYVIIILLIINLFYECTDICIYIHYFRCFESFSSTLSFRLFWGYIDWGVYALELILYAWTTIERHILIFHDQLITTRNKRFFIHYFPPIIIFIYCLLYYTIIFFASQCKDDIDDITGPSLFHCAYENNTLYMYEIIVNAILPTFIVVGSSIVLLLRVVWQKYHTHRQMHWRQYRKMTFQVLIISCLYLILPFPSMFIIFLQLCGVSNDVGAEFLSRMTYASYYTLLLFPIFSIGSLPELRKKFIKMIQFRQPPRTIHPTNVPTALKINNRASIQ